MLNFDERVIEMIKLSNSLSKHLLDFAADYPLINSPYDMEMVINTQAANHYFSSRLSTLYYSKMLYSLGPPNSSIAARLDSRRGSLNYQSQKGSTAYQQPTSPYAQHAQSSYLRSTFTPQQQQKPPQKPSQKPPQKPSQKPLFVQDDEPLIIDLSATEPPSSPTMSVASRASSKKPVDKYRAQREAKLAAQRDAAINAAQPQQQQTSRKENREAINRARRDATIASRAGKIEEVRSPINPKTIPQVYQEEQPNQNPGKTPYWTIKQTNDMASHKLSEDDFNVELANSDQVKDLEFIYRTDIDGAKSIFFFVKEKKNMMGFLCSTDNNIYTINNSNELIPLYNGESLQKWRF